MADGGRQTKRSFYSVLVIPETKKLNSSGQHKKVFCEFSFSLKNLQFFCFKRTTGHLWELKLDNMLNSISLEQVLLQYKNNENCQFR